MRFAAFVTLVLFIACVHTQTYSRSVYKDTTPLPLDTKSAELNELRIRASSSRHNDYNERAVDHRVLHNEMNELEGMERKAAAHAIHSAEEEARKSEEAANRVKAYRRYTKDEEELDTHAGIEAEIAAKKAYLKRLRLEGEASKEQALNEERIWKLRKLQKEGGEKKKTDDKKFDRWFESLFEKLWKEMFGAKKSGSDVLAEKLLNDPTSVLQGGRE